VSHLILATSKLTKEDVQRLEQQADIDWHEGQALCSLALQLFERIEELETMLFEQQMGDDL
jgi:hypothetical protein